jgi:hypothetical protein
MNLAAFFYCRAAKGTDMRWKGRTIMIRHNAAYGRKKSYKEVKIPRRKALSLWLTVVMILAMIPAAAFAADTVEEGGSAIGLADAGQIQNAQPDFDAIREAALTYIQVKVTDPGVDTTYGEWAVVALARGGKITKDSAWTKKYLTVLDAELAKGSAGGLTTKTNYERVILALTALGLDASVYGDEQLIATMDALTIPATTNATIYALLALNSKPYESAATEGYLGALLNAALDGNAWGLSGNTKDIDITGMAIQALAPYYATNPEVQSVVDAALAWLITRQDATTGGFTGLNGTAASTSSVAQVVMALCALHIDPASATGSAWAQAGGKNPWPALLTYYDAAYGSFGEISMTANQMASEQATLALVAYDRYLQGANGLYEMSDAFGESQQPQTVDKTLLNAALHAVEQRSAADYTADSWALCQAALSAAQETAASETATQVEVNAALTALNTAVAALVSNALTQSIIVNISYQADDGGFVIARAPFTVASDLSETYGYQDRFGGYKVSAFDAIVAAHIALFGEDQALIHEQLTLSHGDWGDFVSNFMGDGAGNLCFLVNGQTQSVGSPDAELVAGDVVELFAIRDLTGYLDALVWFEVNGARTEALSAQAGESLEFKVMRYTSMGWGDEGPLAGAGIVPVNLAPGNHVSAEFGAPLAVTGVGGLATIAFSQPGKYILSVRDVSTPDGIPLMAPWLVVTVLANEQGQQGGSDSSVTVSFQLNGDTKHGDTGHVAYPTWIPARSYTFTGVDTVSVYDVFMRAISEAGLTQNGAERDYVRSITYNGLTLSEFDNGPNSGWVYIVNDGHPEVSMQSRLLRNQDHLVWHYIDDYTNKAEYPESGNWDDDPKDPPKTPDVFEVIISGGTPEGTAAADFLAPISIEYIYGADRIATSVAIAERGWTSADSVILVSGHDQNLIDSLAVAPFAGQENIPVLLVLDWTPSGAVIAEIQRLGAQKAYIVGALGVETADRLHAALPDLAVEIIQGTDRQDTAARIAAHIVQPQGIFAVGYDALADAVSAASWAAANRWLILPANADGTLGRGFVQPIINDPDLKQNLYILGGPGLVQDIPSFSRVCGEDRYATNLQLRQTLPFASEAIYTADGATLVDALSGAALAAQSNAAIVLTPANDPGLAGFAIAISANTRFYGLGSGPQGLPSQILPNQPQPSQPDSALKWAVDAAVAQTAAYVHQTVVEPQIGTVGGEWAIIGLARSAYEIPAEYYQSYYQRVAQEVADSAGILHQRKYSEYSRVILALTAAGYDPRNVAGYDLTQQLEDYDQTVYQGMNGPIWALIALDSANYTNAQRANYIQAILDRQLSDGGWALSGQSADPDMTGMALQALAKYQDQAAVKDATDKALTCLAQTQDADGGYAHSSDPSSESVVQVLVALCELGISVEDSRFVKNGKTIIDNILSFQNADGSFSHLGGGDDNLLATEQALYGLVAAQRALYGADSLYRMSDVHP